MDMIDLNAFKNEDDPFDLFIETIIEEHEK
jgi:hypothetical protein